MHFYTNGKIAWLKIPKNACMSWSKALESMGWWEEDLYIPNTDLSSLEFFALIQDPENRHTSGAAQYIRNNELYSLLDDVNYQSLLVSACFDEHTYTIHSMVPDSIIKRTTWFVMDHVHFDYEKLVKNYLEHRGIDLPAVPRLNQSTAQHKLLKQKIANLKQQYPEQHAKLTKNFIGADLRLYRTQTLIQSQWDK